MLPNLTNLAFQFLTLNIIVLGGLINYLEFYLPTVISQTFRFGKHAHEGEPNKWIQKYCEFPKSYFRHFYLFALIWIIWILYIVHSNYFYNVPVPKWFIDTLDWTCHNHPIRNPNTTELSTYLAIVLLAFQIFRRFFETFFIQIFSDTSKINIIHYLVGMYHYFGAILLILSEAPNFINNPTKSYHPNWIDTIKLTDIIGTVVFIYAWYCQLKSNLILVNLRKNKTGKVVTQKHLLPSDGYFKYVSSPHMFFEICIYLSLSIVLYDNHSFKYCLFWVVTNQIENALLTHKWYLKTFKDTYPMDRKAIIPKLL